MKKIVTKKIITLFFSVVSLFSIAQCVTVNSLNVTYGSNGSVTVTPVMNGVVNPSQGNFHWVTYGGGATHSYYQSALNCAFTTNANYTVCLTYFDSSSVCPSSTMCSLVSITNCAVSSNCNASYSSYTDTNCVTHFLNTSTGTNLTYHWYDMSNNFLLLSSATNPTVSLSNGTHIISLYTYSNGVFCDSITHVVSVTCTGGSTVTPTGCQAHSQFNIFADTLNVGNYFAYNMSTGSGNLSYLWNFGDGTSSTLQYPTHQYAVPGQYVVCLTVTGTYTSGAITLSCSNTSCDSSSVHRMSAGFLMHQINVIPPLPTGVKNMDKNIKFQVYPNPINDELTIECDNYENVRMNYVLMDAIGRIVLKGMIDSSKLIINTKNIEKGFYNLNIMNESGVSIKLLKLVK